MCICRVFDVFVTLLLQLGMYMSSFAWEDASRFFPPWSTTPPLQLQVVMKSKVGAGIDYVQGWQYAARLARGKEGRLWSIDKPPALVH